MTIPSVLAVMTGSPASEKMLDTVYALVGADAAYVEALHVKPRPEETTPMAFEAMSGATVSRLMDDLQKSAEESVKLSRQTFDDYAKQHGLNVRESTDPESGKPGVATFRVIGGNQENIVAQHGRLFDLVAIASPALLPDGVVPDVFEAALFRSGRPVLIAPDAVPGPVGKNVVLAWSGAREAARVLSETLPILKDADQVTVLTCRDSAPDAVNPEDVVKNLARHGVDATAKAVEKTGTVGETILGQCTALEADLLVMGGYGHSRLREFVLGGVTRSMIHDAKLPIIMAH